MAIECKTTAARISRATRAASWGAAATLPTWLTGRKRSAVPNASSGPFWLVAAAPTRQVCSPSLWAPARSDRVPSRPAS